MKSTIEPRRLLDVAKECAAIYDRCAAVSSDIFGGSLLDLMADNIADVSIADLKSAIVVSGIEARANARIRRETASYR